MHVHPDEVEQVDPGCLYKTKCVIRLQKNFESIIFFKRKGGACKTEEKDRIYDPKRNYSKQFETIREPTHVTNQGVCER
jgi:hypothetical protein